MNDFLTLMTAQLQNQDPLDPTDSNQFLSAARGAEHRRGHLPAEYSANGAVDLDAVLAGAVSARAGGPDHPRAGDSAQLHRRQPLSGAVQVPTGASNVAVSIAITNRQRRRSISRYRAGSSGGLQSFSWNGTGSNGAARRAAPTASALARRSAVPRRRPRPPRRYGLERDPRAPRQRRHLEYPAARRGGARAACSSSIEFLKEHTTCIRHCAQRPRCGTK